MPGFLLTVALSLAVALVPRLVALAGSDFPLNDGGMVDVMIRELMEAGFRLPVTTSYNTAGIPFAYPPLALYVAAALAKLTGVAIPSLLRWLPLLANLGTVAAFCALARSIATDRWSAFVASLLFPTLPLSIEWLLTGGGLTRSFGVLFVTLGALAAHRYLTTRRAAFLAATVVSAAGAVLSHPEAGASMAATLAVFWLLLGRDRAGLTSGAGVAAGVAILTAPWWLTVVARHGLGPLLAAGDSADWSWAQLLALPAFFISGETAFTPIAVFAVLGVAFDLIRRRPLVPAWLLATFLFPRPGSRELILPLALLAGEAIGGLVVPALKGVDRRVSAPTDPRGPRRPEANESGRGARSHDLVPALLVLFVVAHGTLSNAFRLAPSGHPIPALSPGERSAMAWVAANTPEGSRFLLVTSSPSWAEDPASEWFPALTGRVSVATPQGREWLPGRQYRHACASYDSLKSCANADVACLERWTGDRGESWTHLFIPKVVRGEYVPHALAGSLAASPEFVLAYNGPGALVFARRRVPSQPEP